MSEHNGLPAEGWFDYFKLATPYQLLLTMSVKPPRNSLLTH